MTKYEEELRGFIKELSRYGDKKFLWKDLGEKRVRVYIYTDNHFYAIDATSDYLGCVASSRKPRPGEDWTRGSDLSDGKLNKETWHRILADIVGYELKSISGYILEPPKKIAIKH